MRKKSNKKTHEKIHEESLSNTDLNQSVSLGFNNQLGDSHPVLRVLSLEEILTIENELGHFNGVGFRLHSNEHVEFVLKNRPSYFLRADGRF